MKRKTIVGITVAVLLSIAGPALAEGSYDTGATQKSVHTTYVDGSGRHFK